MFDPGGDKSFAVKQIVTQPHPIVNTFDTRGVLQTNIEGLPAGLGYTGLLLRSPRYLQFLRLWALFNEFDGNSDILLLTFSRGIFRGYFEGDFRFSIDAESPWNWKYGVTFKVIQGLDTYIRGGLETDATAMEQILRDFVATDPLEKSVGDKPLGQGESRLTVGASPLFPDENNQRFLTPEDLQVAVIYNKKGVEEEQRFNQATTVLPFGVFTGALGAAINGFFTDTPAAE